jgi:hypothetical protein
MSYNAKVYQKQGGDNLVVESGGVVSVKAGGAILIEAGGKLRADAGAVTLASNAGTLNKIAGQITTEALTTAAAGAQELTVTCDQVVAGDLILVTRNGGTSATGTLEMKAVAGAGSFVVTLTNRHASAAFNGTFIIGFVIIPMAA